MNQETLHLYNEYGLEELHQYYLTIMDDFHEYCVRHGIQYSLSGGSLIGAVRHAGFIPWDDDVDVMFDRDNYLKFLETFCSYPLMGYEIIGSTWVKRITRQDNPLKDKEERCVDLFVFDSVPKNNATARMKVLLIKILQGMMKEKPEYERFSFLNRILLFVTWLIGRPFPQLMKMRWYDRISQWGKECEKINIYNNWFNQIGKLEFDKHIVDGYLYLEFEGRKYMVIEGYHSYLTELYGDYMTPPPQEERKPTHMK